MPDKVSLTYNESILLLTAFAAGAVDVISFATLGGVFASAMTGNFALLAYYVAQSDSQSAMGSVVALVGFAVGCALGVLQRRGRAQEQALSLLLASEAGLLLFFALYSMWTPHVAHAPSDHLQIVLARRGDGIAGRHRPNHQPDHHRIHDHAHQAGRNHRRLHRQRRCVGAEGCEDPELGGGLVSVRRADWRVH